VVPTPAPGMPAQPVPIPACPAGMVPSRSGAPSQ
jgi:hypothetical protein